MKFDIGIVNNQPVPTIVKQAQLAESLGYETVWITDSHLICRELWVTLAACALGTKRIKLGTGVTVPHTRHWSVAASAIASLEELAPGRVILGIGTGGSSAETMGLSVQRAARLATLDTMVTSIRRLLAGQSAPLDSGMESRLAWLGAPRPIPIYVAGSGPRMLEAAGRLGDGVIMYAGTDPAILKAGLACVARGAVQQKRALADLDVVLWTPTAVDRDRALARDHVRGRVASAMRHPLPVPLSPEDHAAVRRLREAYDSYQHATAGSRHRELVPDRFVDMMALAGTPEEVREQVRRVMTVPEIRRIIVLPQNPGQGFIERESILRTFADEVVARLR
ncbi:MAG: 5,10-methylene tetrahydromethanopterin reductase [Candidatus Rokuibacteriota bacterium]|nr:MAG: 5,10-methylene tetrahydromethanopterin reductase [Candidatus Rokubacteria bacterium]